MTVPMQAARRRIAVAVAVLAGSVVAVHASGAAADACSALPTSLPAPSGLPVITELPDPFKAYDGTRLTSPAQWSCRRAQLSELIQTYEYGHLPPAPTSVTATRSGTSMTVTVTANGRTASFTATVRLPSGTGPFPALILLNGLAASATSRGYAEVSIAPNSIAADSTSKTGTFWSLYPNSDAGTLMAWSWGVHRTLDAIKAAVPEIDSTRVGVSGYSRYGKAAIVAGAFDERIALTVPGSSGTAGAGNFRFFYTGGSNDETLNDILGAAYWFTPQFAQFRNQNTRLPFDQHSVAALVAPRPLLITSGTEGADIRTNPRGTGLTYRGAKMVYQYLGISDRIGIAYRPGGHQIDINDYNAIMDFADKHLKGLTVSRTFDSVPFPAPSTSEIPWTLPSGGTPTTTGPTTGPTTTPPTTRPTTAPTTPPTSPGGGCTATVTQNSWTGGFVATVRLAGSNTTRWAVTLSLPAGVTVTNSWSANRSGNTGTVTFTNVDYNPRLPTEFGFQASGNGAVTAVSCTAN